MKNIKVLAAVIVFFLLGASSVSACSCMMESTKSISKKVKEAFTQSSAVFYGEVLEVNRQENSVSVKFRVSSSWKGKFSGEVIVQTAENSAMCGYNFEIGKRYLVYANGESDKFQTNICTRTAVGNADAKYLNKIKKPKYFLRGTREI